MTGCRWVGDTPLTTFMTLNLHYVLTGKWGKAVKPTECGNVDVTVK